MSRHKVWVVTDLQGRVVEVLSGGTRLDEMRRLYPDDELPFRAQRMVVFNARSREPYEPGRILAEVLLGDHDMDKLIIVGDEEDDGDYN
jgi:hypothetical protein